MNQRLKSKRKCESKNQWQHQCIPFNKLNNHLMCQRAQVKTMQKNTLLVNNDSKIHSDSSFTDTSIVSQSHMLPALPSPPPIIVQSTIQTAPTPSPIIVPIPKPQPPRIEIKPEIKMNQNTVSYSEQPTSFTSTPITMRTMTTACPTITTAAPTILTSSNVVYSEQQTTTIHTTAQNQNSNKLAQEQENEQFALAWLRATFEPVSAMASRIEQQDLYKMYLTACSKIGRTGVVSQFHFPRCVRNVFGGTVGPNQIKIKQNAISNFFYEGIRIRAQPLAVVHKGTILVSNSIALHF